jgi:hypothetical protein
VAKDNVGHLECRPSAANDDDQRGASRNPSLDDRGGGQHNVSWRPSLNGIGGWHLWSVKPEVGARDRGGANWSSDPAVGVGVQRILDEEQEGGRRRRSRKGGRAAAEDGGGAENVGRIWRSREEATGLGRVGE